MEFRRVLFRSDLVGPVVAERQRTRRRLHRHERARQGIGTHAAQGYGLQRTDGPASNGVRPHSTRPLVCWRRSIRSGAAADRKRVVSGKRLSVRVVLGGLLTLKKQKTKNK